MKKIIVLFILVFSFQSCFRIHKARRIDEYKLYDSKLKNSTTSYGFRLKASRISFYPNAKRFFKVEGDYLPDSFITTELYSKEKLEVSFYLTSDRDKYLDFFTGTFNSIIGVQDGLKGEQISQKGDEVYNYVYVKVKDLHGNDVFTKEGERKDAVIEKLNEFRAFLNY